MLQYGPQPNKSSLFIRFAHVVVYLSRSQVLEWDGTSLIDRSFEEVCTIMDRTGDVAELLVEHSTDLRICDLLEDGLPGAGGPGGAPGAGGPRKSGDGPVGLGLVAGKLRVCTRFLRVHKRHNVAPKHHHHRFN